MCCDDHTCLSGQSGFASFIGKDFPRDTIISKLQPSLHSTGWKLVILKLAPCVYTVSRTNNSTVVREEIQESFKVCYTDCTLPVRTSFCFEIKLFIRSLLFLSKHFFFSLPTLHFSPSLRTRKTLFSNHYFVTREGHHLLTYCCIYFSVLKNPKIKLLYTTTLTDQFSGNRTSHY